ncbi:MAG: type II secretion system protein [Phycisphaerales bacterium]|nr:type II secretion system protein [Phycisphaerales bacterium]
MIAAQPTRAFTLIEILVVLGIITILGGLMMPAFKMVRAQSQNSACLSNLRQTFTLWQSYQTMNKGTMPMCEFLPVVTPQGVEGGLPNLLANFIPVESPTWFCPADVDADSLSTGTSYTYLPGLLRYTPQVQFQVAQVLIELPAGTTEGHRQQVRLNAEAKLVSAIFAGDTKALFPLLMDSEDRHPGTREPRNGVYLDGAARAIIIEQNTTAD